MQFNEFLGKVRDRARLESLYSAMRSTRATLNTLAECLHGNEPTDLAAQLPGEIGEHLQAAGAGAGERCGVEEFVRRVNQREGGHGQDSTHHARVVLGVLSEAVSRGEMKDMRRQLPEEYDTLFKQNRH
jgi:uncharacterized protein (DUF2267 family)